MADRPGITIGEPGQREVTYTGLGPSYRLPMRQMFACAIMGCGFVFLIMVGVATILIHRRGLEEAGGFLSHNWWWLVWFYLPPWGWAFFLGWWRMSAEVVDPSYPGARAATPMGERSPGPRWPWTRDKPPQTDQYENEISVCFEGTIHGRNEYGRRKSLHWRMHTRAPKAWQWYARALTGPVPFLRPRFSVRQARRFHVPDDEFQHAAQGWERIGYIERTGTAKNSHRKLTEWGFEYLRKLAHSPTPQPGKV